MPFSLLFAQVVGQAPASQSIVGNLVGTFRSLGETMGVDGPRLLSQVVLFAIVAFCLRRFAYEPILKILDQRAALIKQGIENAARVKEELAEAQAQHAQILLEANVQATQIVEEAKKTAALQSQKQLQEAIRDAEGHFAAARESAKQEREKMLLELRKEVLRLVLDATTRATGKILTPADQERIKAETLSEVSRN